MSAVPAPIRALFATRTALPNELDAVLGGETALVVRPRIADARDHAHHSPADTDARVADARARSGARRRAREGEALPRGNRRSARRLDGADRNRRVPRRRREALGRPGVPRREEAVRVCQTGQPASPTRPRARARQLPAAGVPIPNGSAWLETYVAYGAEAEGRSTFTARPRRRLAWRAMSRSFSFTSESVTEGTRQDRRPDLRLRPRRRPDDDPNGRVACETLITTGLVVVAGEITTECTSTSRGLVRERFARSATRARSSASTPTHAA